MTDRDNKTTHFGFEEVPLHEKVNRVRTVFSNVAHNYDLMNDVMSLGLHRLWKKTAISESGARSGQVILDLAGGTGDLTKAFANQVGKTGRVVLADINDSMLREGRDRLMDQGIVCNIEYVQADAEQLPFPDHYFDHVMIAFGLRNVTDKEAALRSMYRVLKPGGNCIVLEFSKPTDPWFNKLYDAYSFNIIPKLGAWIARDEASYRYLAESIRRHPDQETLKYMMETSGFEDVQYQNLTGGIVALHKGYKY